MLSHALVNRVPIEALHIQTLKARDSGHQIVALGGCGLQFTEQRRNVTRCGDRLSQIAKPSFDGQEGGA